ncbi:hypothetical protein ODJ79_23355 [Actinoplanes sp. KI2]|uniref:hypothetical protein n=1 Tax=Actinoplanes sp. KI2 TaxID=2983315 RepID=UPI0021D57BC5|nr:hypothetical protein [Actinoplanes sp. KI2]MCU7726680.1 hypothetical protein [Actinoplanes sp. KI2]
MSDAEPEGHGPLASFLIMARLMIGWCCTALGALGLLMGFGGARYLTYHAVLLLGGLALLAFRPMVRRPRPIAYVVGGGVTALGLMLSAVPRASRAVCCHLSGYAHPHGFPLAFVASGHFDPWRAFADLLFWALVGLIPLVVLTRLWPAPAPGASVEQPAARPAGHAEQRAEVADDENVGGLP